MKSTIQVSIVPAAVFCTTAVDQGAGRRLGARSATLPEGVALKQNLELGGVTEWLMVAVLKPQG